MKKCSIVIGIIFLILTLFGCKSNDTNTTENNSNNTKNDNINYTIDRILLSKSFQSTEPSIEVIDRNGQINISASLGILESSGVEVSKIVKKDNDVNIHVKALKNGSDLELSVPQIVLTIKKSNLNGFDNLKFNIINDNYDPLKIKFQINEVLSKVKSHFEISPSQPPKVNLSKSDENILWTVSYDSIIDREEPEKTLINLHTTIDAITGDIIDSEKSLVSSPVDEGSVLDYASNGFLLYKKLILNDKEEKTKEQLWSYNLSTEDKEMLFSSPLKIISAKYSNDLSNVSIIEASDEASQVYIVPKESKKAYKISFEEIFNPGLMDWKDDNNLYLIESNDEESKIVSYNVKDSISKEIVILNKNIQSLLINEDNFLIEEFSESEFTKKISLTKDWKDFNFIDSGFKSSFIGSHSLAYLVKDEKLDSNSLNIYNLEDEDKTSVIDENISNFQVLSNDFISYVKKNSENNNFTLSKYNLNDNNTIDLGMLINDKIYLDTKEDVLYSNITLPFENINPEIIYSIELSNLK